MEGSGGTGETGLIRDKWGQVVRPFESTRESVIEAMLDRARDLIDVISADCGLPAYIAYGTLLGAVRDGKLIGHDNDVDVAYLSACEHPADVARESFAIQRALRRRGWEVGRVSGGFLQTFLEGEDGERTHVDVFSCFTRRGRLYQVFAVDSDLPRSAIVPLGEVTLHGRRFPAPAMPEALLEATYGPRWRVPDPGFRFEVPRATRVRLGAVRGWLGGYHTGRKHWDAYFSAAGAAAAEPSAFARWVAGREPAPVSLTEAGCGDGRDAIWLAARGHRVVGLDYAPGAIELAAATAARERSPAGFELFNLYDLRQVLARGAQLACRAGGYHVLFVHDLLDHIDRDGRAGLWRLAALALRPGGRLYLELSAGLGDTAVAEIEAAGGTVEYREAAAESTKIAAKWRP